MLPGVDQAVTTGEDGALRFWSLDALGDAGVVAVPDPLRSCSVSDDGRLVAAGDDNATLQVWDAATRGSVAVFDWRRKGMPIGPIRSCTLGAGGTTVAAIDDGVVQVFDVRSGAAVGDLERRRDLGRSYTTVGATAVVFLPDGRLLAAYQDGSLGVWTIPDASFRLVGGHDAPLESCAAGGRFRR